MLILARWLRLVSVYMGVVQLFPAFPLRGQGCFAFGRGFAAAVFLCPSPLGIFGVVPSEILLGVALDAVIHALAVHQVYVRLRLSI